MAVYTHLTEQQIKQFIDQHYGLNLIRSESVAEGIENTIYKIICDSATFVLVILENVPIPAVEAYCAVLEHIAGVLAMHHHIAQVPKTLRRRNKSQQYIYVSTLETDQGVLKPVVIQQWIEGTHVIPNPTICGQLGVFLGKVNGLSMADFAVVPDLSQIPRDQHLIRVQCVKERLHLHPKEVQADFDFMMRRVEPVIDAHSKMQYGFIHGDLFPDNALANQDQITGIIDFFNASWSPMLLDLAICLIEWCVYDGVFEPRRTQALLRRFVQNCDKIPSFDREQWLPLVELAIFRFWCTRQEYQLNCRLQGSRPVPHRNPQVLRLLFDQVQQQKSMLEALTE